MTVSYRLCEPSPREAAAPPTAGDPVFAAATCAPPRWRDGQLADLLERGEHLQARLAEDPSAQSLRRLAHWQLLWPGRPQAARAAVELLEGTPQAERDADYDNDLAVAYYERALRQQEPLDLFRALEAVERALRLEPGHAAGRFNRALFLERLHLVDAAAAAWGEAAAVQGAGPWGAEASAHAAALASAERAPGAGTDAAIREAACGENRQRLARLSRVYPAQVEAAGVALLADGLGHDATAGSATDLACAERLAATLADLGSPLLRQTLEQASQAGAARLASLRRGLWELEEGRQALHHNRLDEATRLLSDSRRRLEAEASPARLLAATLATVAKRRRGDSVESADLLGLAVAADDAGYATVAAQLYRLVAIDEASAGRWVEALRLLDDGQRAAEASGDALQTAMMAALSAEAAKWLGAQDLSWRRRFEALRLAGPYTTSLDRLNLLYETADALASERLDLAAGAVLRTALEVARQAEEAGTRELFLAQTLLEIAARAPETESAAGLVAARRAIDQIADPGLRGWLLADLDLTAAGRAVASDPTAASRRAAAAAAIYAERGLGFGVARATLVQARAALSLGDLDAATERAAALVALIVPAGERFFAGRGGVSLLDGVTQLYEELLAGAVANDDTERALVFAEQSWAVLWSRHPAGASALGATVEAGGLSRLCRSLPEEVVILRYLVVGRDVHVVVLRRDGVRLQALPGALDSVASFRAGSDGRPLDEVGATLAARLVAPLAADLEGAQTLVVVPHGVLHSLPWAALVDERGDYFIERYRLLTAPALVSLLGAADHQGAAPHRRALVVGDPDFDRRLYPGLSRLTAARREAEQVAGLYAEPLLMLGAEATSERFLAALAGRDIVHFAGHAVVADGPSSRSRLLFSADEGAFAGEIGADRVAEMDLRGKEVVVLSACSTGRGGDGEGEATASLAQSFLFAGARSVLASLWDVDDEDTSRLMVDFHREMVHGSTPAEALNTVQRRAASTAMPVRSWAALQLFGGFRLAADGAAPKGAL